MDLVTMMQYELRSTTVIRYYSYNRASKQTYSLTTFSIPQGASWGDIIIQFIDGHTVRITCNSGDSTVSGIYNFTQMGMVDRRRGEPNHQWRLLEGFAKEQGQFSWQNTYAHPRQKKQKQLLKKMLQAFFGIYDEDPFNYVRKGNQRYYQALFTVLL